MAPETIVSIGDIHGCSEKLIYLLRWCEEVCRGKDPTYVFLGDYIDRGPDARGVVELLIRKQRANPDRVVCLRGNHEQLLINASVKDSSDRDLMTWFGNGGEQTLESYGCNDPRDIPAEHLSWFRALPRSYHDGIRFYVHAGVRPGVGLAQQADDDLLWIREPFLSSDKSHGSLIVHGHSPVKAPDLRTNRLNLDTGACFGGRLTAAIFDDEQLPAMFINDRGEMSWPT